MSGHDAQAAAYLSTLLSPITQERYNKGVEAVNYWTQRHGIDFYALGCEEQDFVLADFALDSLVEGLSPQSVTDAVAAISRRYLNHRVYKVAARVVLGWKAQLPVNGAPPIPDVAAYAFAFFAVINNDVDLAFVVMICFVGFFGLAKR